MPFPIQEYVALVDGSGNLVGLPGTSAQGRLTLTTLVPVLTAAVATAATVYYTPYVGNFVPIYDGTVVMPVEFTELSNILANSSVGSAGPAAGAASENYDMFVWNNGGTLTLTRGPVWTSAVVRSAGTALVMVKGILLNNAAITNGPAASRGTYVGTIRTDAGGATVSWSLGGVANGGTPATVNVWNMYNQVPVIPRVGDNTATWPYTSVTWRAANASNGSRISFVRGLDVDGVDATYKVLGTLLAALGGNVSAGVTLDATTTPVSPGSIIGRSVTNPSAVATTQTDVIGTWQGLPGLGFHFFQATEAGDGTNANTFSGGASGLNSALWARMRA